MTRSLVLWRCVLVAGVLAVASCSSDSEGGAAGSTTTAARRTTTSSGPAPTAPPTSAPDPLDDQTAPESINGITVQGDTIWVASINDDAILQVRRDDGAIVGRFDTAGAGPDDVAVAPDGSVYATGFRNGDVGRVADGRYSVVTKMSAGINPIAFGPDGDLFIGTYGPGGTVYRVPLDGSDPVEVATDAPDINAFGILDDGTIVAPAGGIQGPGSAVAIDPDDGTITTIVDGLPPVAAGTTDADGTPYILDNLTGEVFEIDVDDKSWDISHTVPQGAPFDNLAFADDGTLYLSSFATPTITEVAPDGTVRVIPIGG